MRRGAGGQSRGFSCDEVVPALPSARGVNERGARLGGSTPSPEPGHLIRPGSLFSSWVFPPRLNLDGDEQRPGCWPWLHPGAGGRWPSPSPLRPPRLSALQLGSWGGGGGRGADAQKQGRPAPPGCPGVAPSLPPSSRVASGQPPSCPTGQARRAPWRPSGAELFALLWAKLEKFVPAQFWGSEARVRVRGGPRSPSLSLPPACPHRLQESPGVPLAGGCTHSSTSCVRAGPSPHRSASSHEDAGHLGWGRPRCPRGPPAPAMPRLPHSRIPRCWG